MTQPAKITVRSKDLTAVLLAAMLSWPIVAQSDIYKVTHPDGSVSFTDQPPRDDDSSTVELLDNNRTNTIPGFEPKPETAETGAETVQSVTTEVILKSVRIVSPMDQTTIPMGPGHFSVLADVTPELAPDETLQLLMDDTPVGDPTTNTTWDLRFVIRGEHSLVINRLDSTGEVIATSEPVIVYVLRPSIR